MLIANVQNNCNVIGREEYNNGRIVFSARNRNRDSLIKNKLITNY